MSRFNDRRKKTKKTKPKRPNPFERGKCRSFSPRVSRGVSGRKQRNTARMLGKDIKPQKPIVFGIIPIVPGRKSLSLKRIEEILMPGSIIGNDNIDTPLIIEDECMITYQKIPRHFYNLAIKKARISVK